MAESPTILLGIFAETETFFQRCWENRSLSKNSDIFKFRNQQVVHVIRCICCQYFGEIHYPFPMLETDDSCAVSCYRRFIVYINGTFFQAESIECIKSIKRIKFYFLEHRQVNILLLYSNSFFVAFIKTRSSGSLILSITVYYLICYSYTEDEKKKRLNEEKIK